MASVGALLTEMRKTGGDWLQAGWMQAMNVVLLLLAQVGSCVRVWSCRFGGGGSSAFRRLAIWPGGVTVGGLPGSLSRN